MAPTTDAGFKTVPIKRFFFISQNRQAYPQETSVFDNYAKAIQLIETTKIKILLPKSINSLKSLYEDRYLNSLTYQEVKSDLSFVKKMIDDLPELSDDPGVNTFYQNLASFLGIKQTGDLEIVLLVPKIIKRLYYFELIDNLILDSQQGQGDESLVPATSALFNEKAEEILLFLALSHDKLYQDSLTTNQIASKPTEQASLDVA